MTLAEEVDLMIAWEGGVITWPDHLRLFQHLVDSGLAWQLQGMYGREAMRLIRAGYIKEKGNPDGTVQTNRP